MIFVAISLIILIVFAVRALLVLVSKFTSARYWNDQLRAVPSPDAIKLVVLGDSIAQGVGANRPQKGLVSKAAEYVSAQTHRPVYVANHSKSGATAADVLRDQLPQADLATADIILFEIGVNDSSKRTVTQFEADMKAILAALPMEKTVVADIPYVNLRPDYQAVAARLIAEHAIHVAYPSKLFINLSRDVLITAGDFFHPNNKGYKLWFKAFQPGIDEIVKSSGLKH